MTLYCQNGYPVLEQGSSKLHTWTIPAKNGTLRATMRNGSVGFILAHNAMRVSELVEDLTIEDKHGRVLVDDWGYALRPIRGKATGYSNHAGGCAFDGNATRHPLGRDRTFDPKDTAELRRLLKLYHGCIRWGGDYEGRKDQMHWEVIRGIVEVEKVARSLLSTGRGKKLLAANPGQKAVILS